MRSRQTWMLGGALAVVVLLVASWFVLLAPQRSSAVDLRAEQAAQEQTNAGVATHLAQLRQQYTDLPRYRAELAALREEFPEGPALPALVLALKGTAADTGVQLTSLVPGTPTALAVTTGAAAAPSTTGTTGVTSIPMTVAVTGSYASTERFVHALQDGLTRAFVVSSVAVANGSSGSGAAGAAAPGDVTVTVVGSVFALPASAATTTATTPATTSAASAATTPATTTSVS